ncbi:MAG: 6-bladed beta-propeller [Bacteroidales bacterium]|jgi:hypothetical protein
MKKGITLLIITLLSVCIIVLTSCSEKKSDKDIRVIDVAGVVGKGRIVDLSEIAKEIRYVPLETTDSSLVGNMYTFLYEAGHIYVRDNEKSIKMFDSTGKYVRTINRCGRGPEEYLNIIDFQVIPKNGNITIIPQMSGILYEYDMHGNCVSITKMPDLKDHYTVGTIKMADNLYLASVFKLDSVSEYSVIMYDSLSNIKMKVPNPELQLNRANIRFVINAPILTKFGKNIRISYTDLQLDTIFSIDAGMKLEKPFIFNYGKFKKPEGNGSDITDDSNIITYLGKMIETEDYLILGFNFRGVATEPLDKGRKHVLTLFDKNSGELTLLNQPVKGKIGLRDNLENGPVFRPIEATSRNQLLSVYSATNFLDFVKNNKCSGKIMKIAEKLNENDNPIIAIVNLK